MNKNTEAYCAGALVAKILNTYKRPDIPPLLTCLVNYRNLKTTLGKYYHLGAAHRHLSKYVLNYERYNHLPMYSEATSGTHSDFMFGYVKHRKRSVRPLSQ